MDGAVWDGTGGREIACMFIRGVVVYLIVLNNFDGDLAYKT
jgi:hypothetical protein